LSLDQSILEELLKSAGIDYKKMKKELHSGASAEPIVIPSAYLKADVSLEFEKSQGINVVAKLPIKAAKSAVLIGAHGDHLGRGDAGNSLAHADEKGQVHFGADDNASGVSGVMEIAHYFADLQKRKPNTLKKNLVFAVWSGEEIGVLGSSAFVKNWDKLQKIKAKQYFSANLNMDMVGRLQEKLYVQGVGSGTTWPQLSEEISIRQAMPMVVQTDPYLPTDSMALYLAEVPAISFFTGAHAEYHSPRDTAATLNYPGLERVTKTVSEYARLLADSTVPMVKYVKVGGDPSSKLEGRSFRIYLGTIPDYTQEGVKGVRISGVSKGSPAELAGLLEKDVITNFAGMKIENIYDYVYTLQSVKAGVETSLVVQRG
ncbi:MAG: M28 family peptidase, partial [Proteobacteria bacterium]